MRDESDRDQQPMRDEYEIYKRYGLYVSLGGDTKKIFFRAQRTIGCFSYVKKIKTVEYM